LALAGGGHGIGQGSLGGDAIGPNPTDRAKNGTKHSVLVEAQGGPLGTVVAAANVHDTKLLRATLEAVVVKRPRPKGKQQQHLCLDSGYDNPTGYQAVRGKAYQVHLPHGPANPATRRKLKHPSRRWVVERTLAWLSKCRALLVRYDKKSDNYQGLLQFACALLWYRKKATLHS
jgi:putative transposase